MLKTARYTVKQLFLPFITLCIILAISITLIAYGRGYRPDLRNNSLKPTGLLSATSDPLGAQVAINGKLKTATNNSINIDPDWYSVRIFKEGYIPWEKRIRVQGEIVSRADAFLFPKNPSLSPLTVSGITSPVLSPDGTKIAYIVTTPPLSNDEAGSVKKTGLWVYELVERTLGRNRDPQRIGAASPVFPLEKATIIWSPDSTQIMAREGGIVRLYQTNRPDGYTDITATAENLKIEWEEERKTKEAQKLAAFKEPIIQTMIDNAKIISFSPDETKILYEATASATIPLVIDPPQMGTNSTEEIRDIEPGKIYVYDTKEDKNYFVLSREELPRIAPTPTTVSKLKKTGDTGTQAFSDHSSPLSNLHWFPTSRHIVLTLEGKIDIMEYDRTNWVTVYAGPFVAGFIAPWPNGSRIIIMTNLNPDAGTLPNLYTVNLR